MSPSALLLQIRNHYCDRLRAAVADHASDGIVTVQSEAVLRRPDGSLAKRGDPATPARVDLVTLIDGQVRDGLSIESETMPAFEPFSLMWEHVLPVRVGPFPWNACDVRIEVGRRAVDWTPLADWFESEFDAEESKQPGEDGLIGVVHTLTEMDAAAGRRHWQIDFGSASIEAFQTLLAALKRIGVAGVAIGKLDGAAAATIAPT